MKRCVLIVTALMVILAPLCASYAAETTFSGEYRARAWSEWNFDKKAGYLSPDDGGPLYTGFFDQRFRLTITHTRSEFLKAVIRFDLVEDVWGQQRNLRMNYSTNGSIIDLAYIDFKVPNLGTFTVGRFPERYGNGLVFSPTDGTDGVRWTNKWDPVTVSVTYSKLRDYVDAGAASNWYNRDTNVWGLNLKVVPAEKQLIELYGGVVTSDNANWLLSRSRDWSGHTPTTNANYIDSNLGFVGLAYTGNFAKMIDVKAEYSRVFGRANMNTYFMPARGGVAFFDDPTVEGWNLYLDASYYNELFRVGLGFVMGSGGYHYWGPGQVRNINLNYIVDSDKFKWGNIIGSGTRGLESLGDGALGTDNNIENLTSVKLYFSMTPMEKLTVNAAVIWAKWTNPVGTNPFTGSFRNPAYRHPANDWGSANYTYQSWEASDDLGWEVDLGFSYEIMEGLTYTFCGGVLFTGDSFDYRDPVSGTREDWGPIWSISNTLMYKF
jgi:hypothetical protein